MRRVLVVLGLLSGMLLLAPSSAVACACVQRPVAAQVDRADSVFEGTLEWTSSDRVEASYGVQVERVFKGRAASFEKLRSAPNTAACGLSDLSSGQRYVFFVDGENPGQMLVERCGGATVSEPALVSAVSTVTGPASAPIPAEAPIAEAGTTGLGFIGWTVVAFLVVFLVVLGATGLRRSF